MHSFHIRAVSFSGKSSFCRGGAPVPALPAHDFMRVSEIGATTGGLPLQENEMALHSIYSWKSSNGASKSSASGKTNVPFIIPA